MIIQPIKSKLIHPGKQNLIQVIDESMPEIGEGSVLVIASKIVSLCEGSVVDPKTISKDELIAQNAQLYLDRSASKYRAKFTIIKSTLMLAAGIDQSNSAGLYVLWPKDPLLAAKMVRQHLANKYNLKNFGVVIADSTSKPMRIGTTGISLAHNGFNELNDYIGTKDLFGKTMDVSKANIAEGLASAAVLAMGEGTEQTPFALVTDLPLVQFNAEACGSCYDLPANAYKDDIYEPFWNNADWQVGNDNSGK